jgi:hypothetical protein
MKQGDPLAGRHQVHRHTIGNGNREQDAGSSRDPAIDCFDLNPSATGLDAGHIDPVYLISQDHRIEPG